MSIYFTRLNNLITSVQILFYIFVIIYNVVTIPAFFLFITISSIILKKRFFEEIKYQPYERFGFYDFQLRRKSEYKKKNLWFLAPSAGEVLLVESLIKRLVENYPDIYIIISTRTLNGKQTAQKIFATYPDNISVSFSPFDFFFSVLNTYLIFKPKIVILIENELWPNIIFVCKLKKIRLVLLNARISPQTIQVIQKIRYFITGFVKGFDLITITREDLQQTLKKIFKDTKIISTGNLKYDRIISSVKNFSPSELKQKIKFSDKSKIITAGSIQLPEAKILLETFCEIKNLNLKMILVPRYINDSITILKLSERYKLKSTLLTKITNSYECLIVNIYGELLKFYSIGDICFVGGSLVKRGGQNILEPAIFAKPILFGPYIFNFAYEADLLKKNNACIKVNNKNELKLAINKLLENPHLSKNIGENAKKLLLSLSKATENNFQLIKDLLNGKQSF